MSYRPLKAHRVSESRPYWGNIGRSVVYWDSPRDRAFYEDVFSKAHLIKDQDPTRYFELSSSHLGAEYECAVEPALSPGALLVLTPDLAEPDGRRFVYLPEEGHPVALTVKYCSNDSLAQIFATVAQAVALEKRGLR